MNPPDTESAGSRPGAEPYDGEPEGPLRRALWTVTTYIAANLALVPILLVFFVLNRTRIYGRQRVPQRPRTLLLSNHQSMIDSFLLTFSAFFPRELLRPRLLPWHPAAEENFFKNRLFAAVFRAFKCIPVRAGRRDPKAIYRSRRALENGTMILFPEGTRTRDGSIGRGRPGSGLVILEVSPRVVPVTITGLDRVLPVGAKFPRFGNRISVYFGRPIDYSDLAEAPPSREVAQAIVDRVMERIRFQRRVIERIESRRGRVG